MNTQLLSFAFDDNGHTDGVKFIIDEFARRGNPSGSGASETFDGSPIVGTFLLQADRLVRPGSGPLVDALRAARAGGHEIAVHTYSHPAGVAIDWSKTPPSRRDVLDVDGWLAEIDRGIATTVEFLGCDQSELVGFRTPYVAHNDAVFTALERRGFLYDCGLPEGHQEGMDGTNYPWPYTLGNGSPGDAWSSRKTYGLDRPIVGSHPSLLALPIYALVVPPDDRCAEYGTKRGARGRVAAEKPGFDVAAGKVPGLDWNFWFDCFMSAEDALATLRYSYDLRVAGNRAPFMLGAHSDIYSLDYDREDISADRLPRVKALARERRDVLTAFLDYALSFSETRVATMRSIAEWLARNGLVADARR